MQNQREIGGTAQMSAALPKDMERPMDRVPLFVFAAVVAVMGVLAASSVYVTEKNDATMKAVGIQPAPVDEHR